MGRPCRHNLEKGRSVFEILTGKPIGKRPQEGLGIVGMTVLGWIFKK